MYFDRFDYWPVTRGMRVVIKTIESKVDSFAYNYDVWCPFSNPEKQMEAARFAEENFKGDWLIGCDRSSFGSEADAMVFKLTFL